MRMAAIDIGTNSVLLLVVERDDAPEGPAMRVLCDRATVTRLGQGVDRSRQLAPEAVARTLACLQEYAAAARGLGVTRSAVVGTSAMRDAGGSASLAAAIRELFATEVRVVEGVEEARLTYLGARSGLDQRPDDLVFDLGGGSTEFVQYAPSSVGGLRVSLPIGSVRLSERHLHHDPPTLDELAAVRRDVRDQLNALAKPVCGQPPIGIAGTVTTLCALARGIAPYDPSRVHGATLSRAEIASVAQTLAELPLEARRGLAALDPKRADVIVAGAQIVLEILDWLGAAELRVSDRGVRYGLALEGLGLAGPSIA